MALAAAVDQSAAKASRRLADRLIQVRVRCARNDLACSREATAELATLVLTSAWSIEIR
jgi:hypothetical protein